MRSHTFYTRIYMCVCVRVRNATVVTKIAANVYFTISGTFAAKQQLPLLAFTKFSRAASGHCGTWYHVRIYIFVVHECRHTHMQAVTAIIYISWLLISMFILPFARACLRSSFAWINISAIMTRCCKFNSFQSENTSSASPIWVFYALPSLSLRSCSCVGSVPPFLLLFFLTSWLT